MSNYNAVITPLKSGVKLRKDTNDEFISTTLYKQIIGSLRYICNIRPYICQSVELLRRFKGKPQECHLTAVKRVLIYIKGTIDYGVLMPRKNTSTNAKVHGYNDLYFSGDQDEKKSTTCDIFMIRGAQISWSTRKQSIMDLSSCESKYIDASYATYQALWIKMLLEELVCR